VKLARYSILFSIQIKKGFQKVKGYRKERRKTTLSPGNNRRSNKREKIKVRGRDQGWYSPKKKVRKGRTPSVNTRLSLMTFRIPSFSSSEEVRVNIKA